jgi:poly(3-hydroxybutyrate) depolymerase
MNKPTSMGMLLLVAAAACASASQCLQAAVVEKSAKIGSSTVHYKVILPNGYDPSKTYPGVLAFAGGEQTMPMIEASIQRNWKDEAERRGYIVVLPSAFDYLLFFDGSLDHIFPELLDQILAQYKFRDNKFHIAGSSNGGRSAFHIAAAHPRYFLSITGFPGYLPDPTEEGVRNIAGMCINMHVGEKDVGWVEEMEAQSAEFRKRGYTVRFTVETGQPHRIETLAGAGAKRLFDQFEEASQGCAK